MAYIFGICGFSQAGKTSVLGYLEKLFGYSVISSSEYLTTATLNHYKIVDNDETRSWFTEKTNDEELKLLFGKTARDMKIHVAEDILVPQLGRLEGIVKPSIKEAIKRKKINLSSNQKVVLEIFNNTEFLCWKKALKDFDCEFSMGVNLRKDEEIIGVDDRELIFNIHIQNNNIYQAAQKIDKIFEHHTIQQKTKLSV